MKKKKMNIGRNIRRIFVRRKYKDALFTRVFQDKKDLLELYNALNHTEHDNPDELEITTLEDAIYLSMKNDVSFIISSTLNLYEHQSTNNPNMPLRGVLYLARLYEAYIKKRDLDIYGRKLIQLPLPVCIVFYNGPGEDAEERILSLSEAFQDSQKKNPGVEPALECKVRVVNINYGHNREIMEACKRLDDYSYFINRVRENQKKGMGLEKAIEEAIDYCIRHDILSDILSKQKTEVVSMLLTEYDKKLHDKTLKREGYEDAEAELLPIIEEQKQKIAEKDQEIEQLRALLEQQGK